MIQLPYVALPREHESFTSVMLRLAHGNGYQCFAHFASDFELGGGGIIPNQWVGSSLYELLKDQPCLLDDEKKSLHWLFHERILKDHTYFFPLGKIILPSYLLRQHLALCPTCTREGSFDHMHTYHFCDVCPRHSHYYIENCPSCGKHFNWRQMENFTCSCGKDLRELKAHPADVEPTKIVMNALRRQDIEYFTRLVAALRASKFLDIETDKHQLLESCQKIATASRSVFFEFIARQQESTPLLHRRAILTPWLLSNNDKLQTLAAEYYFSAHQSLPHAPHCDAQCNCHNLLFTHQELRFALKLNSLAMPIFPGADDRYKHLIPAPGLCKAFINDPGVPWDNTDLTPIDSSRNNLLTVPEVAKLLNTSRRTVLILKLHGLINGEMLTQRGGYLFSKETIESFNAEYILNSSIARNLGAQPKTIHRLLRSAGVQEIFLEKSGPAEYYLIIYKKSEIPSSLLTYLSTPTHRNKLDPYYIPPDCVGILEASQLLKISARNIPKLIEMGVLTKKIHTDKKETYRKLLIDRSCIPSAMSWRKNILTSSEAAAYIGCSMITIHNRFVSSGFINAVRLHDTSLFTLEDVKKAKRHFALYTTDKSARTEYRLNIATLDKWLSKGLVAPLAKSHPDCLRGQATFPREQFMLTMGAQRPR